jgi:hypothetical protein
MPAALLTLAALLAQLAAPLPPTDASAWHVVKTADGIALSTAAPPWTGAAPWGAGEGDVAAPLPRVAAHLVDFPSLTRLVPRLAELRVLWRGDHEALVYFRFDLPWPISDRDWTLRYRWREEPGRFVMTFADANAEGPPPSGAVRVSPLRGYWELSAAAPGVTHARYVFLATLGGMLPRSIVAETAWKQPLETMRGVRAATVMTTDPAAAAHGSTTAAR